MTKLNKIVTMALIGTMAILPTACKRNETAQIETPETETEITTEATVETQAQIENVDNELQQAEAELQQAIQSGNQEAVQKAEAKKQAVQAKTNTQAKATQATKAQTQAAQAKATTATTKSGSVYKINGKEVSYEEWKAYYNKQTTTGTTKVVDVPLTRKIVFSGYQCKNCSFKAKTTSEMHKHCGEKEHAGYHTHIEYE